MKSISSFILLLLLFQIGGVYSQSSKQFNFVYKFQKNVYDSKKCVYSKDMVIDTNVSFKLCLTKGERKSIFDKLKQMDFWNYPENYKYENADSSDKNISKVQPCFNYSMKVHIKNSDKIVNWSDCIVGKKSKENKYEKLRELHNLIFKIISEKKEYKNSPKPKTGYF